MKSLLSSIIIVGLASPAPAAELFWDFEEGIPDQFFSAELWGERDSTYAYGPNAPADSGTVWVGTPVDDLAEYPEEHLAALTTTEIDLSSMGFSALYVSWVQWADFEGVATNFDGIHLLLSTDGGTVWEIVDDPPDGGLQPPYDDQIVSGNGTPLSGKWAYCHDTCTNQTGLGCGPTPSYHVRGLPRPIQTASGGELVWNAVSTRDLIALGYVNPSDTILLKWLFGADEFGGGEGFFMDDLRIADTAPFCLIPPEITVDQLEDTPIIDEDYVVNALVERVCADVDPSTVFLHYYTETTPDTIDVLMTNVGGDNYSAAIDAQVLDTDVWYWVSAADVEENSGRSATIAFEVTEAITLILDDGQPFWLDLGFFETGDGLAARFSAPAGADSSYVLYKTHCYFSTQGLFDVGVWDDDGVGASPSTRLFSADSVANDVDNDWWSFEFDDSTLVFEEGTFFVGFTFVTGDSADNPGIAFDFTGDHADTKWRLTEGAWAVDDDPEVGEMMLRVKVKVRTSSGSVDDVSTGNTPASFRVHGNFPNPFNPRTVIRYDLPSGSVPGEEAIPVRVTVFDLAGRSVATLVDQDQQPGGHSITWSGTTDTGAPLPSGVYFYRIEAGENVATRKMVILK
ncbi:MAG: hypothetical protein CME06_08715 [Gemmatimonadetes bacterium]|nr:hypothetical protein [Gemmatimonadota bacterium]